MGAAAAADGSLPAYGGDFESSGTFLRPHGEGGDRQALAFKGSVYNGEMLYLPKGPMPLHKTREAFQPLPAGPLGDSVLLVTHCNFSLGHLKDL